MSKRVIVIGGGAAGYFSAINLAEKRPDLDVQIFEKSSRVLSKVRISGGGRCNVTHACFDNRELVKNYPRGSRELVQVFSRFAVKETIDWFSRHGVKLKTEVDNRMFPVTDNSETIIKCFTDSVEKLGIKVNLNADVFSVRQHENFFILKTSLGELQADAVICAMGGHPKSAAYTIIKNLGHKIVEPTPSLFTINLPDDEIRKELQGISVETAEVRIRDSKFRYTGPVLITHWGLSGPAILKLSAFAALELKAADYNSTIVVNWCYPRNAAEILNELIEVQRLKAKSLPSNTTCFDLPKRLWEYLCVKAGIPEKRTWAECGKKQVIALAGMLFNSEFHMKGKTTFKEEFVTCGGVDLKEVNFTSMESRKIKGLYFCGEVLNIDGITGGFNFQSAWSTSYVAASAICDYI